MLDEDFYRALSEHPVPVSESALRAIGPRSMVIDIYIWLAYRLHALRRDIEVGWPALYAQFGAGFGTIRRFRQHFLECLALAVAAYPEARSTSANGASSCANHVPPSQRLAARKLHIAAMRRGNRGTHVRQKSGRRRIDTTACPLRRNPGQTEAEGPHLNSGNGALTGEWKAILQPPSPTCWEGSSTSADGSVLGGGISAKF